jgi:hypothetical protein
MRLLGVAALGETPSDDESADGLSALNAMLDSWANENLMVFAQSLDAIPLTGGQTSVTVGPTGSFVTTRPVTVLDSSNIVYGAVKYPLTVLTLQDYNDISTPTVQSIPAGIWCLMNTPDITVTPWPVPSTAMTLNLWSNKQLQAFETLTEDLALPPGYERALAYNLAIEWAPEFEREASGTVRMIAGQSKKSLKRVNVQVPSLSMPVGVPSNRRYDIRTS